MTDSLFQTISFWGLVVSTITLGASFWFNVANSRHNRLMLFNDLVTKFYDIDRRLQEYKGTKEAVHWDNQIFAQMEYMCFLANRDGRIRKHTREFFRDTVISYYDNILKKYHIDYHEDKYKYEEWKKLHVKLKGGKMSNEMNRVALLKAKLDFDKTWSTILMAATLTSTIGYWANRTNQLASWGFAYMAIAFTFVALFFIYQYQSRHNELIDELNK